MKYRVLVVVPIAWAIAFIVAALVAGDSFATVVRVEVESAKALSLVGAVIATLAFDRGDYLRRGWGWTALCVAFLLARDAMALLVAPGDLLGLPLSAWTDAIVLVANVVSIAGVVVLARTWTVAGLEPAESKLTRRGVIALAIVLAVVVSGPAIVGDVRALARGNLDAGASLVSDVADGVSLVVIAPVLLTALALRGGVLMWPWGLLTTSLALWLVYDAGVGVRHVLDATSNGAALAVETCRGLALLFGFSAGIAQRFAVSHRDATIPPE